MSESVGSENGLVYTSALTSWLAYNYDVQELSSVVYHNSYLCSVGACMRRHHWVERET